MAQRGQPERLVMVRAISSIDGRLWAVTLRTKSGHTVTLVVAKDVATIESVCIAAHVAAVLTETGRI